MSSRVNLRVDIAEGGRVCIWGDAGGMRMRAAGRAKIEKTLFGFFDTDFPYASERAPLALPRLCALASGVWRAGWSALTSNTHHSHPKSMHVKS